MPQSRWFNLGDWSSARTFDGAAEALAVRLGHAAGLAKGARVFDASTGMGQQVLVWIEQFSVGKVWGIDIDPDAATQADEAIQAAGHGEIAEVWCGDAADLEGVPDWAVTHALSLDSAYHYRPRAAFVSEAFRILRPGGKLALTDFVLRDDAARSELPMRGLDVLADIDPRNLLSPERYAADLELAGFEDVQITFIDEHVLPGIVRYCLSGAWMRERPAENWVSFMATGAFLRRMVPKAGRSAPPLRYAVITADKPARATW